MDGHRDPLSIRAWRALTLGVPLAFLAVFFLAPKHGMLAARRRAAQALDAGP